MAIKVRINIKIILIPFVESHILASEKKEAKSMNKPPLFIFKPVINYPLSDLLRETAEKA
jgi:hypothetical protein